MIKSCGSALLAGLLLSVLSIACLAMSHVAQPDRSVPSISGPASAASVALPFATRRFTMPRRHIRVSPLGTGNNDVLGYYVPGGSAGPGDACYIETSYGSSPEEAARQLVANNNSLMNPDANGCSQPCSNPATLISVDDAALTGTVQSTCGGEQYIHQIYPIRNPKQPPCNGPNAGNPCNIALGAKVQSETDYHSTEENGIEFTRTYNSATTNLYDSGLSAPWQSNYNLVAPHFDPSFTAQRVQALGTLQFWRTAGQILTFHYDATSQTWKSDPDVTETLSEITDGQHNHLGWTLVSSNGAVKEIYDTTGKLIYLIYKNGFQTALTYNANGRLAKVTDAYGRSLVFNYSPNNFLSSVVTPDGGIISYTFDSSNNLSQVNYPNGSTRTYNYISGLLTSLVDENGKLYATWQYDDQQRPILSTHGDASSPIDRTAITYNPDDSVAVQDALGAVRTYNWVDQYGVRKFGGIDSICSGCGTTVTTT